jgi:hypothetical protein
VSCGEASGERMDTLTPLKSSYHRFAVPCEWLEARIPDMTVRDRFGVFSYNNPQRKSVNSGRTGGRAGSERSARVVSPVAERERGGTEQLAFDWRGHRDSLAGCGCGCFHRAGDGGGLSGLPGTACCRSWLAFAVGSGGLARG